MSNILLEIYTWSTVFCRLDDITYGSFVAQIGYKHYFCAADIVYCVSALLEDNVSNTMKEGIFEIVILILFFR